MLFDVAKDGQKIAPKWVAPEEEQEPNESRRLVYTPPILRFVLTLEFVWQSVGETNSSNY